MDINNQKSTQPFIFVPKAEFKYRTLNSLHDIARVKDPDKRNQLKSFLSHRNGVRSLTKAEFTLAKASKFGQMKLKNIHVSKGENCRLNLTFDHGRSGKKIELETITPVLIRY